MKRLKTGLVLAFIFSVSACGGGGGGGGGGDPTPTGGTTVSGQVSLSNTVALAPKFGAQQVTSQKVSPQDCEATPGGILGGAIVEIWDADQADWFDPLARVLTDDATGEYSFTSINITPDENPGATYASGDGIPPGNYIIIADKTDNGCGNRYIAVQPNVKNFSGAVTGNDLIAFFDGQTPEVTSMFGLTSPEINGIYGGDTFEFPQNAAIQITFSIPMARKTVVSGITVQDSSDTTIPGSWQASPDMLTANFFPDSNLTLDEIYTVTVTSSVKSVFNNPINTTIGKFKAATPLIAPPNVSILDPTNTISASVNTLIRIESNQLLDVNKLVITSTPSIGVKPKVVYDSLIPAALPSDPPTYAYRIFADDVLQPNSAYEITISGVTNLAGLVATNPTTLNFATGGPDTTPPTTVASPAGGTFTSAQSVSLEANESATIYYTVSGLDPNTDSTIYSSPLQISSETTLKFFAVDGSGNTESINTEVYSFDTTAPTTTATPSGGSYAADQAVTLSADETATIYFTTDGSIPTTASTVYTAAIDITADTTLKFFAVDTAGNSEAVTTESYVIDKLAPTTTATPSGGSYNAAQSVSLTSDEPGSTIKYTVDGTDPTSSGTAAVYSGSTISITVNTTLRFSATDTLGNVESPKSEVYIIDTTAPTSSALPIGGSYNVAQSVSLSSSETATIFYTVDGTDPTVSSTQYSTAIPVSASTVLKFFAVDTAGNFESAINTETYVIDTLAATTTASPVGGTFSGDQLVTLTPTETATIYYELGADGITPPDPTTASTQYTGPISVTGGAFGTTQSRILKFFSVDVAGNAETSKSETYIIDKNVAVSASTPGGTYTADQLVNFTTSGAFDAVFCTTDGSTPTSGSVLCTGGISITGAAAQRTTVTLKFIGFNTGTLVSSAVFTETYIIDKETPTTTASPVGGTFAADQSVTLTANQTGGSATIYYTTDGTTPTIASPQYAGPIAITGCGVGCSTVIQLQFFAVDDAGNTEGVKSESYTIDIPLPSMNWGQHSWGKAKWQLTTP